MKSYSFWRILLLGLISAQFAVAGYSDDDSDDDDTSGSKYYTSDVRPYSYYHHSPHYYRHNPYYHPAAQVGGIVFIWIFLVLLLVCLVFGFGWQDDGYYYHYYDDPYGRHSRYYYGHTQPVYQQDPLRAPDTRPGFERDLYNSPAPAVVGTYQQGSPYGSVDTVLARSVPAFAAATSADARNAGQMNNLRTLTTELKMAQHRRRTQTKTSA